MMLFRRSFFAFALAASVSAALGSVNAQSTATASTFVQSVGKRLVATVNGEGSSKEKSDALGQIIDSSVDVQGVARFCLGRYWQVATPQQQREYGVLFHRILIGSITSRIGDYRGVRFIMGRTTSRPEGDVVASTISGPQKAPAVVEWVVNEVDGSPKIVDVKAEGTSLRITQRNDYASFIVHHNDSVQALVDALRRQVSANG